MVIFIYVKNMFSGSTCHGDIGRALIIIFINIMIIPSVLGLYSDTDYKATQLHSLSLYGPLPGDTNRFPGLIEQVRREDIRSN